MNDQLRDVRRSLELLKWMVGVNMALPLIVLGKVLLMR